MTADELKDKIRVIIKKYQDKPLLAPQATQKNVATISEMVNQLNNKIKNLQQ